MRENIIIIEYYNHSLSDKIVCSLNNFFTLLITMKNFQTLSCVTEKCKI